MTKLIEFFRVRSTDDREIRLGSYELFHRGEPLTETVWEKLMLGLSTRKYGEAVRQFTEAYGVEMAFHNAFGPIQNAATLQLDAVIPNFLIQESFYDVFPAWKRDLIRDGTRVENGYAQTPTKPGLGVEVDERVLERHRPRIR